MGVHSMEGQVGRQKDGGRHGLEWQVVNVCLKDQSEGGELKTREECGLPPGRLSSPAGF